MVHHVVADAAHPQFRQARAIVATNHDEVSLPVLGDLANLPTGITDCLSPFGVNSLGLNLIGLGVEGLLVLFLLSLSLP